MLTQFTVSLEQVANLIQHSTLYRKDHKYTRLPSADLACTVKA